MEALLEREFWIVMTFGLSPLVIATAVFTYLSW